MDSEKVKKLLNEKAKLRKAAEEIVVLLVKSGFDGRNLSIRGKSIRHGILATSLISFDIMDDKLTVKIHSSLIMTSRYEELKNLAMERGWAIERA